LARILLVVVVRKNIQKRYGAFWLSANPFERH
jgi:hypothetical protein